MKLEAGKRYKTREGQCAVIAYVCDEPIIKLCENGKICYGFIRMNTHVIPTIWRVDGMTSEYGLSWNDIVSEWPEPDKKNEQQSEAEMKLEPGKYYRTRGGNKAYVLAIAPDELNLGTPFLVVGYMASHDGRWFIKYWDKSGSVNTKREGPHDLVSEWTEPETQTVYIYRSKFTGKKRVFTFSQLPIGLDWERVGEFEIQLDD